MLPKDFNGTPLPFTRCNLYTKELWSKVFTSLHLERFWKWFVDPTPSPIP